MKRGHLTKLLDAVRGKQLQPQYLTCRPLTVEDLVICYDVHRPYGDWVTKN